MAIFYILFLIFTGVIIHNPLYSKEEVIPFIQNIGAIGVCFMLCGSDEKPQNKIATEVKNKDKDGKEREETQIRYKKTKKHLKRE